MNKCLTAKDIIQSSIRTHIDWRDYFKRYPEQELKPEYIKLGGADFHQECIDNYNIAIEELDAHIAANLAEAQENLALKNMIKDACNMNGIYSRENIVAFLRINLGKIEAERNSKNG